MRFLVDLYRAIIIGFCALTLIGGALIVFSAIDQRAVLGNELTGWTLYAVLAAFVVMVLGLGGTAILLSLHDRHAELVDEAERIAVALERIAAGSPPDPTARAA